MWGRRRLSLTSVHLSDRFHMFRLSCCFLATTLDIAKFFKLKQVRTTSPFWACETTTLHKDDLPDRRMGCQAGLEDQNMHCHGVSINTYESLQQAL